MVQFSQLRLHGFKSFTDKTELEVSPGLNGIVGPNGCGKSNLVEALRWVMGENSAKRMRGEGMEDVIFNGTKSRSSRNIAEVSLLLDNTSRTAPALYNNTDQIEISRKIERDKGSTYRINGKVVRARDVQMFFADSVSGASSPALVSQGRITEIIKAKPYERRLILEDSAGISGLFARRHEAELKLRASDNNLQRIEDILTTMQSRLGALKQQVKQATRYKNVNAKVRQLSLLIAHLSFEESHAKLSRLKQQHNEAESQVAQEIVAVTKLTKEQNEQSLKLPELRKQEAESSAALQKAKLDLQRLEDQARHEAQLRKNAEMQKERLLQDHEHEVRNQSETSMLLDQLSAETKDIISKQGACTENIESKKSLSEDLKEQLSNLEEQYNILMKSRAENNARQASLENQIAQNKKRLETIQLRQDKAAADLEELNKQQDSESEIKSLQAELGTSQQQQEELIISLDKLTNDLAAAKQQEYKQKQSLDEVNDAYKTHATEIKMLEQFFVQQDSGSFQAVLDLVHASAGFEKALSRAFGDTLIASTSADAPQYWTQTNIAEMPALPAGIPSLNDHVEYPPELANALSQIGIVEDNDQAQQTISHLKCGQSLVSKDGNYWRWDGLTIKASAADRNALHLQQKNKLQQLKNSFIALETQKTALETDYSNIKSRRENLDAQLQETKINLRQHEQRASHLEIKIAQENEKNARLDSQIEHTKQTLKSGEEDIKLVTDSLSQDEKTLENLVELNSKNNQETNVTQKHAELIDLRQKTNDEIRAYEALLQRKKSLEARSQALGDERVNVKNRNIRAAERLKDLSKRIKEVEETLLNLPDSPTENTEAKEELLSLISLREKTQNDTREQLAAEENQSRIINTALKEAEQKLGNAREQRAHAQAAYANIQSELERIEGDIREQFQTPPAALQKLITIEIETENQSISAAQEQKRKLENERERMGPVNLRAEEEHDELNTEIETLLTEQDELTESIKELRSSIQTINTEARQRLVKAFESVNTHFQKLFTLLFEGGKAHLELVGDDDPLEAGLQIYAQPPGKALQSLSLLSGGEQTMASIALIFAMFLTNPSPICVLDEIDAPLDDANVDRVCNLLDKIAARDETRFIIITHHRLTMARMNCLYGVTMQEAGISQLVSVDLQRSFDFIEAA